MSFVGLTHQQPAELYSNTGVPERDREAVDVLVRERFMQAEEDELMEREVGYEYFGCFAGVVLCAVVTVVVCPSASKSRNAHAVHAGAFTARPTEGADGSA